MYAPLRLNFVSFQPSHHFYCHRVCLILLYVPVGVYLLWREGCAGFQAHIPYYLPLLRLGVAWAKALIFLPSPCFPFLCLQTFWLLVLPYHFVVLVVALPLLLLPVTPWACGQMLLPCQPTSSSIFCSRLPRPTFYIFTSFGLCWPAFLLCQPITSFLRLSQPVYFIFTSFTAMSFLLDTLDFIDPITTSLYLITFLGLLAFKPTHLSLSIHFLGFPDSFTSSLSLNIPMDLLLHSLGFLGPFTSSLPLFYSYGLAGH